MSNDDQDRHWLGHRDDGTSPIVVVAMSMAKVTLYLLAALLVLISVILLWKQGMPTVGGDWGMYGILGALIAICILLARKIGQVLEEGA